jgi:tetratricopeptide (TPR) repeat protein
MKVQGARGLDKAALSALNTGRPIKAKRLFGEAIDAGSTNPRTYVKYADLLGRDSSWDKAIPLLRKAIELDPLDGDAYLTLGRALIRSGNAEEGRKTAKLALEVDPEDLNLQLEASLLLDD